MSNNNAYDQRLADLLEDYETYLDEHGGRILLRPDITIRLDYMNMTLLSSKVLLELMLSLAGQTLASPISVAPSLVSVILPISWHCTSWSNVFLIRK